MNIFGVFRVKNHDFTPKKIIFFSNFRGARAGCAPHHLDSPLIFTYNYIFHALVSNNAFIIIITFYKQTTREKKGFLKLSSIHIYVTVQNCHIRRKKRQQWIQKNVHKIK